MDIKKLVINLLDDSHGVNEDAYTELEKFCKAADFTDVLDKVVNFAAWDGKRYFLQEGDAEDIRKKYKV